MMHNVYFVTRQDMIRVLKRKLIMQILLLSLIFMIVPDLSNI